MNFTDYRINRIARTFSNNAKNQAILIADTIDNARICRGMYCPTGEELRADYYEYVYDNSFARRRRRWFYRR